MSKPSNCNSSAWKIKITKTNNLAELGFITYLIYIHKLEIHGSNVLNVKLSYNVMLDGDKNQAIDNTDEIRWTIFLNGNTCVR